MAVPLHFNDHSDVSGLSIVDACESEAKVPSTKDDLWIGPKIEIYLYPADNPVLISFELFTRNTPSPTVGTVFPELSFISLATGRCAIVCLPCALA